MNKKNLVIFILFLLLLVISLFVYKSKSKLSTLEDDSRNFKVRDTANITKIFIADKVGNQSTIARTKLGWTVNNKFACRSEAILNLLEVIKHVEVKMGVPDAAKKNVIKLMASNALKVEIYSGDELIKQYYVGNEIDDSEGSYMLLTDIENGKNYENPYACFIPGFKGYLQPRFICKENEWRDRTVINFIPPQIKSINVNYFNQSDSSFSIHLAGTKTFYIKNGLGQAIPFDEGKLKQYLIYFQNISYEGLITNKASKIQDSLSHTNPFVTIIINTQDFKTHRFDFYRKQFLGDINPEMGIKYNYDPDRLYMNFDSKKEWAIIQYFVFGKLFVNSSYFTNSGSVKK